MKMILYHFLLKKMAFLTFASFILSKSSFLLSLLVAIKQYLSHSKGSEHSESQKLEVVHIPIRKYQGGGKSKHKGYDYHYSEESKPVPSFNFPPITYSSANIIENTTPETFFDFNFKNNFYNEQPNFENNYSNDDFFRPMNTQNYDNQKAPFA